MNSTSRYLTKIKKLINSPSFKLGVNRYLHTLYSGQQSIDLFEKFLNLEQYEFTFTELQSYSVSMQHKLLYDVLSYEVAYPIIINFLFNGNLESLWTSLDTSRMTPCFSANFPQGQDLEELLCADQNRILFSQYMKSSCEDKDIASLGENFMLYNPLEHSGITINILNQQDASQLSEYQSKMRDIEYRLSTLKGL